MRILIVDDSKAMRTYNKRCLKNIPNIETLEAADGAEAMSLITTTTQPIDLILMDRNMPNMGGLEFVQKFRMFDKKTPIIMVTTENVVGKVKEAIVAGTTNYILKPFTPEALEEKVLQVMVRSTAA